MLCVTERGVWFHALIQRLLGGLNLTGKKVLVFIVALVAFSAFFFYLDNSLQHSQGLELIPSGKH